MAHFDCRDLPVSTRSEIAAVRYREGVDLLLAAWPGAAEALDAAIAADSQFGLALAARARLHAINAQPVEARALISTAAELAARSGSERERSHIEVLSRLINGRSGEALEGALAHADAWPRDALILSLPLGAFGLFAFSGMADHDQARVDLCSRHARHYGRDDWWFLASRGWAEAENGDTTLGRAMLHRAYDLRPENANTVHGWAHALFEAGAATEGAELIAGWLPNYDRSGVLHGHIAWHAALLALEQGDAGEALSLYARHVRPGASMGMPINVVSDVASLLWRVQAYGHEVGAVEWLSIAEYATKAFPRPGHAFVDIHMGLIEAMSGDAEAVERRVAALSTMVQTGVLAAGKVVPAVCRAALAFADEDYALSIGLLEPVMADVVRLGGSGAQRQVIEDTLLVAYMRNGDLTKARGLLDRRLHRRPSLLDSRWMAGLPETAG